MAEAEHFIIERMNVTQQSAKDRLNRKLMVTNALLERARQVRKQSSSISYREDGVPYTHLQENL